MTKINFNPKRDLPYLAALAQVVQFTIAGYTLFGLVGAVSGFFLGALVSMTVAYAASQFSDIAKERKKAALFFMVILLAFSPIVVGTAAYLELPFTGIWAAIVAAAWGILPDFSVALDGFVAGKGMVKKDEQTETKPAKLAQPVATVPQPVAEPAKVEPPAFTRENLLAQYLQNPRVTLAYLAQVFGKSHTAVGDLRDKMIAEKIIRRDGKEIKPIPAYAVSEQVTP